MFMFLFFLRFFRNVSNFPIVMYFFADLLYLVVWIKSHFYYQCSASPQMCECTVLSEYSLLEWKFYMKHSILGKKRRNNICCTWNSFGFHACFPHTRNPSEKIYIYGKLTKKMIGRNGNGKMVFLLCRYYDDIIIFVGWIHMGSVWKAGLKMQFPVLIVNPGKIDF